MPAKIDRSQLIRLGVAAAMLIIAVVIFVSRQAAPSHPRVQAYYLDLGADTLIASDSIESPTTLPSGAQAVRANVTACGSCADESARRIAYVEKTEPVAAQANDRPPALGAPPPDNGVRVSDDGGKTWRPAMSDEGGAIISRATSPCPGGSRSVPCMP